MRDMPATTFNFLLMQIVSNLFYLALNDVGSRAAASGVARPVYIASLAHRAGN
jgi:hypothetical protein